MTDGQSYVRDCQLHDEREYRESQLRATPRVPQRGPTCKEYAYALGHDQAKAMGIPLSDEPLEQWAARCRAAKRGKELPPALRAALTAVAEADMRGDGERMT